MLYHVGKHCIALFCIFDIALDWFALHCHVFARIEHACGATMHYNGISILRIVLVTQNIALDSFHCFKLRCICALSSSTPLPLWAFSCQRDVGSTIPCSSICTSGVTQMQMQMWRQMQRKIQIQILSVFENLCQSSFDFDPNCFLCENPTSSLSDEKPVRLWAFLHCVMCCWPAMGWFCPVSNQCLSAAWHTVSCELRTPHFTEAPAPLLGVADTLWGEEQ